MAGGQPVVAIGYRFTARPLSRWRRLTRDFLPYWQGSKPRFVLTVTRLELPSQSQDVRWFVRFATGDITGGQVVVRPLQTSESDNLEVGGKFLGFTGDTLVILPTDLVAPNPTQYHTVYAFHTTNKTWIFLTFVVALLAGAFSTLGQWLLWVCK